MKIAILSLLVALSVSLPAIADEKKSDGPASKAGAKTGNIAPYRKDMLKRVAENWHPSAAAMGLKLQVKLSIAKDGTLKDSSITGSSGNKDVDKEALDAVKATKFAPLPEFFQGDKLDFTIDLSKVKKGEN